MRSRATELLPLLATLVGCSTIGESRSSTISSDVWGEVSDQRAVETERPVGCDLRCPPLRASDPSKYVLVDSCSSGTACGPSCTPLRQCEGGSRCTDDGALTTCLCSIATDDRCYSIDWDDAPVGCPARPEEPRAQATTGRCEAGEAFHVDTAGRARLWWIHGGMGNDRTDREEPGGQRDRERRATLARGQ